MNIGIVTTWFERGAAYVSRAYADILSTEHSIFIFARGGEAFGLGDPKWDQPNVTWTINDTVIINKIDFINWINENNIQIIIFNEQEHWWPPILWANEAGIKTIAYVDYYTKQMIPWFSIYDGIWCNTKRHFSVFKDFPSATFIPWGTDIDLFRPINFEPKSNVVFFHSAGMGGINLRKGTDILVRSFQHVTGATELIIHSQVPLDTYGNEIANLIKKDRRITFIERSVPAPGLYHLGDVYVYPNRLDGIGLSVTEALACGLPVICTDSAPCNEIVIQNRSGWLIPVGSVKHRNDNYYWPETECNSSELIKVMQHLADNTISLSSWKTQARNYAVECLDWKNNTELIHDSISKIVNSPLKNISMLTRWDIQNYYSMSPSFAWRIISKLRNLLNFQLENYFYQSS